MRAEAHRAKRQGFPVPHDCLITFERNGKVVSSFVGTVETRLDALNVIVAFEDDQTRTGRKWFDSTTICTTAP